jgi:predicted MFS family arabinose efflux permease
VGIYSAVTWGTVLRHTDRAMFDMTLGSPVFRLVAGATALANCVITALQAWGAPFVIRTLGANPAEVGLFLGVGGAAASACSLLIGGICVDRWRQRDRRAPLWMMMISLTCNIPVMIAMIAAPDLHTFTVFYVLFTALTGLWAGVLPALVLDLVPAQMRAATSAALGLITIVIAIGIGPYWVGKISTATHSLATGLYSILILVPIAVLLAFAAARRLPRTLTT